MKHLDGLLESRKKFVVFAHHANVMDGISHHLQSRNVRHIRIDGKVPSNRRTGLVTQFQTNDECRVALLSITAASTGFTVTAASLVVFAEVGVVVVVVVGVAFVFLYSLI